MDEKVIAKALFKKLSALRATLSDEEQALLDRMVEGEFDVEAHLRVQPAADERRPIPDADERRPFPATDERRPKPDADEAAAHYYNVCVSDRHDSERADYTDSDKEGPRIRRI